MIRSFAVVPAAGRSRRMGVAKLLLEVDGRAVIDRVLEAWGDSRVTHSVVVVRADDERLIERCRRYDVQVVAIPAPTESMRDTLEFGLEHLARQFDPQPTDAWLVAPADMPGLRATAIDTLLECYNPAVPQILVPQVAGANGHPVLLPWSEVPRFQALPRGLGLDSLVRQSEFRPVAMEDRGLVDDVDSPEDYEAWNRDDG